MIRRCLAATRRLCLKSASVLMLLLSTSQIVAQDLQLGVDLSPGPSGDWVVAYTLSEPVAALVFARGNGDYRKHSWSFSDDQFVIDRIGGTDKIRRRDNEAFSEVIASLKPYTDKPSKDYTPFLRFSDGGMAVFTGQFIVGEPITPLESDFIDGASNRNTLFPPSASLRVTPGAFSRMIVGARIVEQSTVLELFRHRRCPGNTGTDRGD
jgi:hypothetical protein